MMKTDQPHLVVWRFLDGKAGHESQSLGLVKALERRASVEVYDFPVAEIRHPFLQWLVRSFRAPPGRPMPDLLVGAGHGTHWLMLAARRACGGKTVVLMRPSPPIGWFDYAIIPEHDAAPSRSNVITTKGVLNPIRASRDLDPGRGLILIGGPSKHHGWDGDSIVKQVCLVLERYSDVNWTLTTSRRTPERMVKVLDALDSSSLEVVPFAETGPGWVADHLASCGKVWVSEDSVSMVFEALSSGAAVGLVEVPTRNRGSRVIRAIDGLKAEGFFISPNFVSGETSARAPLAEADRVADLILKRLANE